MGHAIYHDSFSVKKSRNEIYSILDQRAIEEGDYHSGLNANIRWYNRCFPTIEEAEKFLESNDKGWYDQLAVKYKYQEDFKPSKALEQLYTRQIKIRGTYNSVFSVSHFRNHKSKLITCKSCTSKIATPFLESTNYCPVCRKDMRPDSVKQRLERLKAKINELDKEIADKEHEERLKQIDKAEEYWLVKTEFHV